MKVFFDVDGVLIDGWHVDPHRRNRWDATIEKDLGIDKEQFQRLFFRASSSATESIMENCVVGKRDLKEALASVLPTVGFQGSVDTFVAYWFEKDANVNAEVLDVVVKLHQIPDVEVFVATGQEHYRAAYLWNHLKFSSYFEQIFYSAELGYSKKDIRFFESINTRLGIDSPEAPLFFDDRADVVALAGRAGWDAVIFKSIDDLLYHPRLCDHL
ncbi:MAG: HAD family hydrolase [Cyanobacteria bacterium P01_A01_bin.17]